MISSNGVPITIAVIKQDDGKAISAYSKDDGMSEKQARI